MTLTTHCRFPRTSRRSGGAWSLVPVVALLMAVPAARALALSGRVDARNTHQEGRSGSLAYNTSNLREVYSLNEYLKLSSRLYLSLDAVTQRETLESRSLFQQTNTEKTSMIPSLTLSYRTESYRLGLSGRASRIDDVRTGATDLRDEHFDLNLWLSSRLGPVQVDAKAQEAASWRYIEGGDRENREHNQSASLMWDVGSSDQLRYRFSRNQQNAVNLGQQTTFMTNNVQYRGDHRFASDRGRVAIYSTTSHFRQNDHRNDLFARTYVQPLWSGFALDDTPEFLDPLELDPVAEPSLFDNDRRTPTMINIGDNASVVREFGGDYRNIILDFGEPVEMIGATLYVDRTIDFPSLVSWHLFVSDDPEGRNWGTELSPGDYELRYLQLETGEQGWTVDFRTPLFHRRLKLVDVKIGPTQPDIFVTEFEVYRTAVTTTPDVRSTVINNRTSGQVDYDLTPQLSVRYAANFSNRFFDDSERDLRGLSQSAGANWRFSEWMLSGQYETHTLRGQTRRDTDANSQNISLSRSSRRDLAGRLSYNRTVDNSYAEQHVTHSVSGDVVWRMAPLLVYTQRVSYGLRSDPLLTDDSRSWSLVSELRGTPRPSLSCELRRADRWVSQQAGYGFTTFNDTDMTLTWSPVPLVQLTSQAIYQVRTEKDWFYRNTLSWTPLTGGSLQLRLQATDQQDTRSDYWQRGGGATLTWRPRPTLKLAAGFEKSRVRQYGERNTPLSYQFSGNWTF